MPHFKAWRECGCTEKCWAGLTWKSPCIELSCYPASRRSATKFYGVSAFAGPRLLANPEPGVGEVCQVLEVDPSVKIEIGNVAVSARLPDDVTVA